MAEEKKKTDIVKTEIPANGRGLQLLNLTDMYRFAQYVVKSQLAPSSFKTPEQILIAIQSGAELGIPPMRALQSFCVIRGNARLWGDAPLALVRQSNQLEYIKEWLEGDIGKDLSKTPDEVKAICETKRKGDPESMQREFSVGDARRGNLWNKKTEKGYDSVWMNYPKRLLQMRARALNLRDNFPDCFGGATIAEEYEGVEIPQAAPGPEAPSREDRKQAADVKVTDTKEAIKEQLEKCLDKFIGFAESEVALNRKVDVPSPLLNEIFAKFAASVLKGDYEDYRSVEAYTLGGLLELETYLERNGIPDEILALFPMTVEEAETHLEEKLREWKYKCICGHQFDEPGGSKKVKLCPKCLSKDITEHKPAEVKK